MHRLTGIGLSIALLALIYWLYALSSDTSTYAAVISLLQTRVFSIVLLLWIFAFFFHLGNGLRHLIWDVGRGFELRQVYASGWLVVGFALMATAITGWSVFSGWN
jgi:succinate dehydrogenase / fumarate reductase cytochrome b subunit